MGSSLKRQTISGGGCLENGIGGEVADDMVIVNEKEFGIFSRDSGIVGSLKGCNIYLRLWDSKFRTGSRNWC